MAISIELCVNGVVVDGFEVWWDEMDSALDGVTDDYPLLERVDAYGDVEFTPSELGDLEREIRRMTRDQAAPRELLERVGKLVTAARSADRSVLRFRGD
jgi:hypothetical protein